MSEPCKIDTLMAELTDGPGASTLTRKAAEEIARLQEALLPFRSCDSTDFEFLLSLLPRSEQRARRWIDVIDRFRPAFAHVRASLGSSARGRD